MDQTMTFTVSELVGWLLAVCAGTVTISKAVDVLLQWRKKAREPGETRDARLDDLTDRVTKLEEFAHRDKERLDLMDRGQKVTQQALLALLGHAIDGNNQEQLENARDNLHRYLVER